MVTILSCRFPAMRILTLDDFPGAPEPDETGVTYRENACIKAQSAAAFTGHWSLADDAGLEIDALPGELGHLSKRFAGEETPFAEKMRIVLERMEGVPEEGRGARFRCSVALADPADPVKPTAFEAVCEGRIARVPSGMGGFGYDPIFWLPDLGCTMADLTADQKHRVSHRGKVLRLLGDWIEAQAQSPVAQ